MQSSWKRVFRGAALIGIVLLFASMFLDWYYLDFFRTIDDIKIGGWTYNIMTEWGTSYGGVLNDLLTPNPLGVPQIINLILFGTIFVVIYGVLFQDFEKQEAFERAKTFSYVNLFLLILNAYYILIFPIVYLIPSNLYFPFLTFADFQIQIIFHYCVGPGYLLQVVAFPLMFPYFIFHYQTITQFEKKQNVAEVAVKRFIAQHQEKQNLGKLITEELNKIGKPAQEVELQIPRFKKSKLRGDLSG